MIHVEGSTVTVEGQGVDVLREISVLCIMLARENEVDVNVFNLIRKSADYAEQVFNETKTEGEITS